MDREAKELTPEEQRKVGDRQPNETEAQYWQRTRSQQQIRQWQVGDLIKHYDGVSLCVGQVKEGIVWLSNKGKFNISNAKNTYNFSHNTGLSYKYIDRQNLERDHSLRYFDKHFIV